MKKIISTLIVLLASVVMANALSIFRRLRPSPSAQARPLRSLKWI